MNGSELRSIRALTRPDEASSEPGGASSEHGPRTKGRGPMGKTEEEARPPRFCVNCGRYEDEYPPYVCPWLDQLIEEASRG